MPGGARRCRTLRMRCRDRKRSLRPGMRWRGYHPARDWSAPAAATAAVFPSGAPLNNAILLNGNDGAAAAAAIELTGVYADAGVEAWALWCPAPLPTWTPRTMWTGSAGFGATRRRSSCRRTCRRGCACTTGSSGRRSRRPPVPATNRFPSPTSGSRTWNRDSRVGDGARRGGDGRRMELPARAGLRDLCSRHCAGMAASGSLAGPGGTRPCRCTPDMACEPRRCNRHESRSSFASRLALNQPRATRNGCLGDGCLHHSERRGEGRVLDLISHTRHDPGERVVFVGETRDLPEGDDRKPGCHN